jgi:hypothetical protein
MKAIINRDISDVAYKGITGTITEKCGNEFFVFMPDNRTKIQESPSFKGCIFPIEYFDIV